MADRILQFVQGYGFRAILDGPLAVIELQPILRFHHQQSSQQGSSREQLREQLKVMFPRRPVLRDQVDLCVNSIPAQQHGRGVWTAPLGERQNGLMRPRASRPDALQSVTVLEALESLAAQHEVAGVPFKELEAATRSRLNYRALTDALNALVNEGAVKRVTEKPARLAITEAGRKRLDGYRS